MSSRGRPPVPVEHRRNVETRVYLSTTDRELLDRLRGSTTVSDYMRGLLVAAGMRWGAHDGEVTP